MGRSFPTGSISIGYISLERTPGEREEAGVQQDSGMR